ncbi:outer membrane protein [Coralliovum pocilloporae]|uniref:outer membrane protein n=1 Tax=Coralliovum pocilloporae TaxID=3066369 RepID=UPI003306BFFF
MKKLICTSLILLAGIQMSHAADLPSEPEYVAPVPISKSKANLWDGAYIGALIGYGWAQFDNTGVASPDSNGIQGGLFGGYNFQVDQYVFGIETDFVFTDFENRTGTLTASSDWTSTVRLRAGVTLDETILIYGTGGLALAEAELDNVAVSHSQVLFGYTIGAGVETFLTDNVIFRAEYLYTDFQDDDFVLAPGVKGEFDSHSIRMGVSYKF